MHFNKGYLSIYVPVYVYTHYSKIYRQLLMFLLKNIVFLNVQSMTQKINEVSPLIVKSENSAKLNKLKN